MLAPTRANTLWRNPVKYLCEDGFANKWVAMVLAVPAIGTDCTCCLGARIWAALFIGGIVGWLL